MAKLAIAFLCALVVGIAYGHFGGPYNAAQFIQKLRGKGITLTDVQIAQLNTFTTWDQAKQYLQQQGIPLPQRRGNRQYNADEFIQKYNSKNPSKPLSIDQIAALKGFTDWKQAMDYMQQQGKWTGHRGRSGGN